MLVALRATHEHLDLGVLDALTQGSDRLPQVIEQLNAAATSLEGWVVVSTCNRLEIYLDARRFHEGVAVAARAVATTSGLSVDQVSLCLETAMGRPVTEHLYEVVAGLRSIVLGEAEVAGQVRAAFERAQNDGHATPMLNDLFQIGFRFAKRVASRTPVGAAGRSGVSVALDLAEQAVGPLSDAAVLVVGTGAYARVGVADLHRRGARRVQVHSPSGRGDAFAERHGIDAVRAGELPAALAKADLVLACSGRGPSLSPEMFDGAGRTLVLDLALHSDLHPGVRDLSDVDVLGLAELSVTADAGTALALAEARRIVADGVEHFASRQEFRRVDPAMASLRRALDDAAEAEVQHLVADRPDIAEEVERSIRRILAKVMHSPTTRARQLAQEGKTDEYVEAFHTIFGIDIRTEGEATAVPDGGPAGWMRLDTTVPPDLDAAAVREALRLGAETTR